MMPIISRIGGVLKARMPNPKSGTVSPNPASNAYGVRTRWACWRS
jgi:ribosomal protein L1